MDDSLNSFVEEVCNESHLRVENDYGDGFVRLRSDEAQRRQAIHDIRCSEDILVELLRNSRDAHARKIFVALSKIGSIRNITIIDDGDGVPEHMHKLIFEPRVTSKLDTAHIDKWGVHGRGMALYSISMNANVAEIQQSALGLGCALAVQTDTTKLKEKTDQSTFPEFLMKENNTVAIKGPKNLLRTLCEFSLEHRNTVEVYFGSPADIASTLYAFGLATVSSIERAFAKDVTEVPICKRLAFASDENDFTEICKSLGLALSSRTARRIMDGQIKPEPTVLELIQTSLHIVNEPVKKKKTPKVNTVSKKVSFQEGDLREFEQGVRSSFGELAESYYLDSSVEVSLKVVNGNLLVSIPLIDA